ncbi:MAG: HAMP domain-containing sensor histidine kinase [Clostridia bacterium]|jgi:integral membrane sensor signal transduction histidine kinase|nr:HAMP domain-containing sensor histidine kinase [Clostridia bacterium]HJJ09384.1 HAMP domain-containing histidine kinase [Clostridiaceae bacterium]
MEEIKLKFKSVRFKLFFTMCVVILVIILSLVLINSIVLENFYIYSKTATIKQVYQKVNDYYNTENTNVDLKTELKKIAYKNNFDILIKTDTNLIIFTSDREFLSSTYILKDINEIKSKSIEENETKINVKVTTDEVNNISYMFLTGILDNGYVLYIRMPISPIEESVKISNTVLLMIGGITLVVAGIIASFISRKFTNPILQLNDIANKMAKLDFSKKYRITDTEDEINELGRSINTMSDKLEATIKELQKNNIELEKDIEEKSKIDEMRKQFISDVSHELKTPIALIQGYAEGLIENVNSDEESRKFYAEVILDETNKMDKLVKQLLELMKLEYGKREFDNEKFNINELINEVLRKCSVMINEKNIKVYFENKEPIYVYADEFYMDQIITNYLTNAIKHAEEVEKETKIEIKVEKVSNKIRVSVFNTGENIPEEDLQRIWGRFYKLDSSRNRQDGGSGIGLALVKAIMNNYQNEYGVKNKKNGVEFYFDMDISD